MSNHLEKTLGKALEEMGSGANVRFPPIREGVVATASTPSLSRVLFFFKVKTAGRVPERFFINFQSHFFTQLH